MHQTRLLYRKFSTGKTENGEDVYGGIDQLAAVTVIKDAMSEYTTSYAEEWTQLLAGTPPII